MSDYLAIAIIGAALTCGLIVLGLISALGWTMI